MGIIAVIRLTFGFGVIALAAWAAWTVYSGYRSSTGTTLQRLRAGARGSATLLWGKFCVGLSAVVTWADSIADMLGQPDAKQYINDAIGNPKIVGAIMLAVSLVSMWSRLRTLTKA